VADGVGPYFKQGRWPELLQRWALALAERWNGQVIRDIVHHLDLQPTAVILAQLFTMAEILLACIECDRVTSLHISTKIPVAKCLEIGEIAWKILAVVVLHSVSLAPPP